MTKFNDELNLVLCGEAGQGINTIETLLVRILKDSKLNIFATKEYMSRVRGGSNSTTIRISSKNVRAFKEKTDLLIPLDSDAIKHVAERISKETLIIGEKAKLKEETYSIIDVPFSEIASKIGNPVYSNSVSVGMLCALLGIEKEILLTNIEKQFKKKGDIIAQKNIEAAEAGHIKGKELTDSGLIEINIKQNPQIETEILINGAEAVALGAISGGCNFVSAYPMTPSTGIFQFLCQYSNEFDIVNEQAEDEISAVNMALGASYAGARAVVTTSGGGFALMVEGLSLAGMIETPLVIILSQRPGPATGLPTRTEQADLEFALYSGHGEFPRIILAPGTIEEAFYLTNKAFNMADKFQTPVILLVDQYFVDTYYNIKPFNISETVIENQIIKTKENYKRYEITDNGISPRGIPGFGQGLVMVDSDEHDEFGRITEDLNLRTKMVDKRLKKMELIKNEIIKPTLIGNNDYKNLLICWGSTLETVKEAMELVNNPETAMLHVSQVYPLHPDIPDYLKKAENLIIIENNATGQFKNLIKLHTGYDIKNMILKYNGLAFSVEEIAEKIVSTIKEKAGRL